MTGTRRITLALAIAMVAGAAAAGSAAAASTAPGAFAFDVSSAAVGIGSLPATPIATATLGQPVGLSGTIDAAGAFTVPRERATFPAVDVPIPKELVTSALSGSGATTPDPTLLLRLVGDLDVKAAITATSAASGTVDPVTGAATLDVGVGVGIGLNGSSAVAKAVNPIVSCGLAPLPFRLTTAGVAVPGAATTLTGRPYDAASGLVTLVGAVASPPPACRLSPLVAGLLGGADPLAGLTATSLGAVTVELTGTLNVRSGGAAAGPAAAPALPVVAAPVAAPPAPRIPVAVLTGPKTVTARGRTVALPVSCRILACAGRVRLTATGGAAGRRAFGATAYRAAPGRTTTVAVTLPRAARTLLQRRKRVRVRVAVSVAGGPGAQRTITVRAPAPKRR